MTRRSSLVARRLQNTRHVPPLRTLTVTFRLHSCIHDLRTCPPYTRSRHIDPLFSHIAGPCSSSPLLSDDRSMAKLPCPLSCRSSLTDAPPKQDRPTARPHNATRPTHQRNIKHQPLLRKKLVDPTRAPSPVSRRGTQTSRIDPVTRIGDRRGYVGSFEEPNGDPALG
jgi:hypothetical protein